MTSDALNLPDDAYWSAPTSTLEAVFERLSAEQFNGVVIGAPQQISFESQPTIPIVAYRAGSYRDMRKLSFSQHAVLVGVDLERNLVRVAEAVDSEADYSIDGFKPVPEGYTIAPYIIDARQQLTFPWKSGSYLFRIIMRDRISNSVKTDISKLAGFRDEAVEQFIAEHRRRKALTWIEPAAGDPLPCYHRLPESPEAPGSIGMALKIDRVLLLNRETRWTVYGAFRLPAITHQIVSRITLLGVGADYGNWTIELPVPSCNPGELDAKGSTTVGYFALDLKHETQHFALQPQTYFIYAVAGETVAGPFTSALVPDSWLLPER